MGVKVLLKNVRLSYPNLWEARQFNGKGSFTYGATALIEPESENDKKIRAAIKEAAAETWGDKAANKVKSLAGSKDFCYRDGDLADKDEYEGLWYLGAKRNESQGAPAVVDRSRRPLEAKDGKPYGGCYVNMSVEIWAQKGEYTGIRCTLIGVQFYADGDAFAGARATADDFEQLDDDGEGDDFGVEDNTGDEDGF